MRCLLQGFAAVTLVVAVSGCSGSLLRSAGDSELDAIALVFKERDYEVAATQLEGFVERYPDHATAWTLLGHSRTELDRLLEAGEAYGMALALEPNLVEAITGRGVMHRRSGDYDSAMADYERAVQIDPEYAEAWSSMAAIEILRYRDDKALEHARRSYELRPNDAVILANLAIALHYNNLDEERDEIVGRAEELGYHNMEMLQQVFNGTRELRDRSYTPSGVTPP